jgi:hypothetical protein
MTMRVLLLAVTATLCAQAGPALAFDNLPFPSPRIAVVLQPATDFVPPPSWAPGVAQSALEFGVKEACVDEKTGDAIRPRALCQRVLVDMPRTDVCYEPALSDILSNRASCGTRIAGELVALDPATCANGTCGLEDAARIGVSHLLIVDAAWSYELSVMTLSADLVTVSTGEVRKVSPLEFARDMKNGSPTYNRLGLVPLEILKWFAREITIRLIQGEPVGRGSGLDTAAVASSKPVVIPLPSSTLQPSTPAISTSGGSTGHRWLGFTLVGVGIVSGTASISEFAIHGDKTNCTGVPGDPSPCLRERHALVPGIAFGLGALGAFAGAVVSFVHHGDDNVAISVQPTGIVVGGNFR